MSRRTTVQALAGSCHPEPVAAVTAISTALAVAAGLGWRSLVVGAAVFTGQLSIGWCNDYLDRDRDRAALRPDKPVALGLVSSAAVGRSALVSLLMTVPLSLALGWRAALAHALLVGGGWFYNLVAKPTALSVVPYLVAFGALPSIVTLAASPTTTASIAPGWATAGGALLGASAHFTNTLPDLADDERAGVRGLPHRLGRRGSLVAAVVVLAAACLVLAFGPGGGLGVTAVVLLALAGAAIVGIVIAAGRADGTRDAFRLTVLTAVLAVALLVIRGNQLT
ncbi:MAG: UbiA family prenyltransferase [Mycobacteriales bacterium]